MIELSQNYIEKDDSGGPIEECRAEDVEPLANSGRHAELADIFGDQPLADAVLGPDLQVDNPGPEQLVPEQLWGEAIRREEGEAIPETGKNVKSWKQTTEDPK